MEGRMDGGGVDWRGVLLCRGLLNGYTILYCK